MEFEKAYEKFLNGTASPEEIEFVVEYGSIENAPRLRLYIREHASLICSANAVSQLAALA